MTLNIIKDLLREMQRQNIILLSGLDEIKEALKIKPVAIEQGKHKETHEEMLARMARVRAARKNA